MGGRKIHEHQGTILNIHDKFVFDRFEVENDYPFFFLFLSQVWMPTPVLCKEDAFSL